MLLAGWLLGCGAFPTDAEVDPHLPALEGEPFWTLELRGAPAPLPAWVRGELPDPEALPSAELDALLGRFCAGADPGLNGRMEARLDAEAAGDAIGPWTAAVLDGCTAPAPPLCRWVADRVATLDPEAPVPRGLFELWHVAGGCTDPALWSWMPRPGGSLYGAIDYLAVQDSQWRPIRDPGVPDLVAGVIGVGGLHGERVLLALGAADHPDAARALLDHRAARQTQEERDAVAAWLYRQSDPEARVVLAERCARDPSAWQCAEGHEPMARLDEVVAVPNVDLSELLDRHPAFRSAVLDSLDRCLEGGVRFGEPRGGRCLRALVGAGEEARALSVMTGVPEGAREAAWARHVALWERFGGHQAIGAHLLALGLVPEGFTPTDPREPPVYLADWFVEADRGLLTAGKTQATWLREVLARVPELADDLVVVRTAQGPEGRDELLVWQDDLRYRTPAVAGSVDVRRVTGLLNALAAARRVDVRFVTVAAGDLVVWGPEAGLRSVFVDDALIEALPREDPVPDALIEQEAFYQPE